MKIGFVSTRLAGVSLETAKLAETFMKMGYECFYCAGELEEDSLPGRLVPQMHFNDPIAKALHDEAFRTAHPDPSQFRRIYTVADGIRRDLEAFVDDFDIDLLISQNANSIPMNLSLGIAIAELIKRTQIKAIGHHHDFYWELDRFLNNGIQDILDEAFPPRLKTMQHMVISTVMRRRLYAWRGIRATYLPNVFDFENPPDPPDEYALTFRQELGLSDDDLIVLQPTRVIRRKQIEKAIELIRKLEDSRLVFLITGYEGDEVGGYGYWLKDEADRAGIRYQFIADYVGSQRGEKDGHKVYSLWDIYPHAHFITYPSVYEGFGNALIETLYFRKPIVVHTYGAYLADIKPCGVEAVEFYYDVTDEVVEQTRRIIDDAAYRERITEQNYEAGRTCFSYTVLRQILEKMLNHISEEVNF